MKHTVALLLGLAIFSSAQANGGDVQYKKIAILSLIGDVMTIDTYRQRVGTSVDSNRQQIVPLPTPVFDHTALVAAEEALTKLLPTASVATLMVPTSGSDSDPARLLTDDKVLASSSTIAALRENGFTQLLAIAKFRAPARLQLFRQVVGNGHLRGLGFYVDNILQTKIVDSGEVGRGFIAPYVYIRLVLLDLKSLASLGDERITVSEVRSAASNSTGSDSWGAITPAEKVSMLQTLIQEGIAETVPRLLRPK